MATIDSLIDDIRGRVAVALPDKGYRDALRWAAREFMRKTYWLRETVEPGVVEGTDAYALIALTADTEVFAIQAAQLGSDYLTPATQEEVAPETRGWYMFEPPNIIQLSWSPTAADALLSLLVRCVLVTKTDATTIPDSVLRKWDTTISYGALLRLFSMKAAPWFDAALADHYEKLWTADILLAAQEAERQSKAYAYGTVRA